MAFHADRGMTVRTVCRHVSGMSVLLLTGERALAITPIHVQVPAGDERKDDHGYDEHPRGLAGAHRPERPKRTDREG